MSSQGPYGRHGYTMPNNNGAGAGYATPGAPQYGGGGGGYSAPGQGGYGGASYSAPAPPGGYSQQYTSGGGGGYGGGDSGSAGWGQGGAATDDDGGGKKGGKKSMALQSLNQNVLLWAGFFTLSIFVYYLLSGGDFSFLMTYGAMARMFGFGILNVKTFTSKRATGISAKSLQLYSIVFIFRLSSILRHEGYLPYDKSGDWLYHFIEFASLSFCLSALYGVLVMFKDSYQPDADKFGELNVPPGYGAVYLAGPVFLLACLIHPNLNSDWFSDVAWTYSMYLESAALIPQLYMFQKQKNGVVELLTAHFVAALGFGRILEFAFWVYSYHELSSSSGTLIPGYLAVLAQFMQLVLMIDFFWYYFKAVKNATPLVLPSSVGMGIV